MDTNLTKRQKQVLEFINNYVSEHGFSPSVREICKHFQLKSPGGIHKILKALEKKGFLSSSPGKKRSWVPIKRKYIKKNIPVIGQIAAGLPIDAQENLLEELPIDESIFGSQGCFGLYVKGDSMTGLHIKDGDIAIIRPSNTVDDGQVAAVMVDGIIPEATLKIVRIKPERIELHAANPAYEPIIFEKEEGQLVKILGQFVGLIRRAK